MNTNSQQAVQQVEQQATQQGTQLAREPILKLENLTKLYGAGCDYCLEETGPQFESNICPQCGTIVACGEVNLEVYPGEILGIVGESGSGKSTLVKMLYFDETHSSGEANLHCYDQGKSNILNLNNQKKRWIRNHLMGMVYQHPHLGLRLDFTSGGNIAEKLLTADIYHVGQIRTRAKELLTQTEIPLERMDDLPKHFSGGMQQRVQISKALANNPPLLLLDEVTTGLDVSVQARVLDLIRQIQRELKVTMIVISHDFSVIKMLTQRTIVMKNGRIVETGLTDQIMEDPQHEYSQLLINSML